MSVDRLLEARSVQERNLRVPALAHILIAPTHTPTTLPRYDPGCRPCIDVVTAEAAGQRVLVRVERPGLAKLRLGRKPGAPIRHQLHHAVVPR